MLFNQNNSSRESTMASWTEGLETSKGELLKKREQLMADGQKFFEAGDFEHCYDSLRAAYEISSQLKDKDAMKFIKARMEDVDKNQKNDFVDKLTSTFRSAGTKKRTQEELTEGLASAVEVVMNGAFALEDKLLEINKGLTDKIAGLEERLTMREKLSEAMVEQIGDLNKKIDDLAARLIGTGSAPAPAQAVPGTQQPMGMPPQGNIPLSMVMPPGMQPGVPPGVGAAAVPGIKGPPSLPPGCPPPASGPGSMGPPPSAPPGMGPPGPPKTAVEKKMSDNPMNLRGSLINELEGALAKRRKALEE